LPQDIDNEDQAGPANVKIGDDNNGNGGRPGEAKMKIPADRPDEGGNQMGKKAVYIQQKKIK